MEFHVTVLMHLDLKKTVLYKVTSRWQDKSESNKLGLCIPLTYMVTNFFRRSFILRQVRERLKKDVEQMKVKNPNFRPGLVVLQVSMWSMSSYCCTYFVDV